MFIFHDEFWMNLKKAFFRRSVLAGKTFECRFKSDTDCMSSPEWLKVCQHCRLKKCRLVGMKGRFQTSITWSAHAKLDAPTFEPPTCLKQIIDQYVHNLRLQRTIKNIHEGGFEQSLDIGQKTLVDIFSSFWGYVYISNVEYESYCMNHTVCDKVY